MLRQEGCKLHTVAESQTSPSASRTRLYEQAYDLFEEAVAFDPYGEAWPFQQALADGEATGGCR